MREAIRRVYCTLAVCFCIFGARFSRDSALIEQASGLVLFAMPREIRTDRLSLDAFQMLPCQAQAGANTEMHGGISGQLV